MVGHPVLQLREFASFFFGEQKGSGVVWVRRLYFGCSPGNSHHQDDYSHHQDDYIFFADPYFSTGTG